MNPMKLLQFKSYWEQFAMAHPKFAPFIKAVATNGIMEGSVIEINVTTPDGRNYATNLKVTQADMELLRKIKDDK